MFRRNPPETIQLLASEGWAIDIAGSARLRTKGLLGRSGLGHRQGMWLPVRSIHTIGMKFPIDCVWLNCMGEPIQIDEHVAARRTRTCLAAAGGVVEVAAGRGDAVAEALAQVRELALVNV